MNQTKQELKNMSLGNKLLAGLLCCQVVLAAGLFWQSTNSNANYANTAEFITVDSSVINAITFNDGDNELEITKENDKWLVSGTPELVADSTKVDDALNTLTSLNVGLPVATNTSSQQQLEVSDDKFQRRVVLKQDSEVVSELLLGTSPGFRKSHVRKAGEDEIYSAKVSVFDLAVDRNDWFDKSLLQFDTVTGLKSDGVEIKKSESGWELLAPADKQATHSVATEKADALVASLSGLRVNQLVDQNELETSTENAESAENDAASSENNVAKDATAAKESESAEDAVSESEIIVLADNKAITLTLKKTGTDVTIVRDDVEGQFNVAANLFDELIFDETELLVEKEVESSEGGDSSDSVKGSEENKPAPSAN